MAVSTGGVGRLDRQAAVNSKRSTAMRNKIDPDKINWRLFKSQKLELLKIISGIRRSKKAKSALDGILVLMDYIQDCHDMEPLLFSRLYHGAKTSQALKFRCSKCKGVKLEEVNPDCRVVSLLTRIDYEGDHDYQNTMPQIETNSGSDGHWYQCANCGLQVTDSEGFVISDCVQLSGWLKTRRYNRMADHGGKRCNGD